MRYCSSSSSSLHCVKISKKVLVKLWNLMGHLSPRKQVRPSASICMELKSQIFPIFTVPFWKSVFSLVLRKTSIKMTIDLPNIFDRNCPLRTLETVAFWSINISKFSAEYAPISPLTARPLSARVISLSLKISRFFVLKRLDSLWTGGWKTGE